LGFLNLIRYLPGPNPFVALIGQPYFLGVLQLLNNNANNNPNAIKAVATILAARTKLIFFILNDVKGDKNKNTNLFKEESPNISGAFFY